MTVEVECVRAMVAVLGSRVTDVSFPIDIRVDFCRRTTTSGHADRAGERGEAFSKFGEMLAQQGSGFLLRAGVIDP